MTLATLSIIENLNEEQIEIVNRIRGPLLVAAGPGSGKTLAIIRRVAMLIQQGVPAQSIIAVTFTNRAAREMKERLSVLMGDTSEKVFVGTLHLLGLRIIQENTTNRFLIYNRSEQIGLLMSLLQISKTKAMDLADQISYTKNLNIGPSGQLRGPFERYQAAMMEQRALDFDDLILKPLELLDNPDLLQKYRDNIHHIIVDEYQDINTAQYRLLRLLAGNNATVCAVGDPDQAIYAFRGADVENFLNFGKDFVGAAEVTLSLNYRCSGSIVRASDGVIIHNTRRIKKEVKAVKGDGPMIVIASVPDEVAEGEFIAREIDARLGGLRHNSLPDTGNQKEYPGPPFCFSDFAVIFRTNNQAEAIEEKLAAFGIPCRVLGGGGAENRREVTCNMGSLLKQVFTSEEMRDQLFAIRISDLLDILTKNGRCNIDQITNTTNHIRLIFGDAWEEMTAGDMVNELNLFTDQDVFDPRAEAVNLMTLHMAKGLEFRSIFISGVEDGLIPYGAGNGSVDIEEERRLFYVGMTRAKEELFLIYKRTGLVYGKKIKRSPSPFLSHIPEACVERITISDRPRKSRSKEQMKLF